MKKKITISGIIAVCILFLFIFCGGISLVYEVVVKNETYIETLGYVEDEQDKICFIVTCKADISPSKLSSNYPCTFKQLNAKTIIATVDVSSCDNGSVWLSMAECINVRKNYLQLTFDNTSHTISDKIYGSDNLLSFAVS